MPHPPALERLLKAKVGGVAVVAHRGNAGAFPENTLPAFESAMDLGVASIEFDVRATRDGVLVCIHDETVDRTTDGRARVDAVEFSHLAPLDAGSWKDERFGGTSVPTLAAAIDAMRSRVVPMVEHKAGQPELYVRLLRDLDSVEDVLLQSFDWDWLRGVRALEPRIPLGALGGDDAQPCVTQSVIDEMRTIGVCFVHWAVDRVDRENVRALHDAGLPICVFTTDDEREFARLAEAGVDMITTNEPARLQRFLGV